MDLNHLPIVLLVLQWATAGLTQVVKFVAEQATSTSWKAIYAQIVAAAVASVLALPDSGSLLRPALPPAPYCRARMGSARRCRRGAGIPRLARSRRRKSRPSFA